MANMEIANYLTIQLNYTRLNKTMSYNSYIKNGLEFGTYGKLISKQLTAQEPFTAV